MTQATPRATHPVCCTDSVECTESPCPGESLDLTMDFAMGSLLTKTMAKGRRVVVEVQGSLSFAARSTRWAGEQPGST